jgi:hypothetical protein
MTVATPTPFQTSTMMTEKSAMEGFPSQSGPVIPNSSRKLLKSPLVGCINELKVSPTAIVLTRVGKKTIERIMCFVFMGEVSKIPKPNPKITLKPQVRNE